MENNFRFQDNYEVSFSDEKREAFFEEVKDREANTQRIKIESNKTRFYEISVEDNGSIKCRRINDNGEIETNHLTPFGETKDIWVDTIKFGSGMCIEVIDSNTGKVRFFPVSSIAKLSLHNRTGISFVGDYRQNISKLALARLYEDFTKIRCSKTATAIVIYGKLQAMMSARYAPISQEEVFRWTEDKLLEQFDALKFMGGSVTHERNKGAWTCKIEDGIEMGIAISDSSSGYSGVIMAPVIKSDNRNIRFDNSWYSRHEKIEEGDIKTGLEAIYLDFENISQKIVQSRFIILNNPQAYAMNVFDALNKLASKMSSAKLPEILKKTIDNRVQTLCMVKNRVRVWDIINIFWDIPQEGSSPDHIEKLQKTVSRILSLEHKKYDIAKTVDGLSA